MTDFKDTTNRHLKHKLQSLARRLDELEEATSKLQKAEDELLDLQDKVIQAEGSNSSLLGDVETLRKRVLKIEGKDEEVRKAEDLCRSVKEKLEDEENLTRDLKIEIEQLQQRMAELEKLEEAFGKSKSDCTQLCLSLNEEKNLTRKLSSELEALKARVKEMDSSEARLDKAEQALTTEMEKLKGLTQTFVSERKRLLEKQREDEKLIVKLTEKLERQKNKIGSSDHGRTDSRDLRIEDDFSTGLTSKLSRKKSLDYIKLSDDVGLRNNEKNSFEGQEDNKVKDLNQEVERLKNRLKQLELVEEDLKNSESKNAELMDKFKQEKSRSQALSDQVEELKMQLYDGGNNGGLAGSGTAKVLENGKAENEEINVRGGFRQEKPKYRSVAAAEPPSSKYKSRDVSPQQRREAKLRGKELSHSTESSPKLGRRANSPAHKVRKGGKPGVSSTADNGLKDSGKGAEEKVGGASQTTTSISSDSKKLSVLSRYPPAANDQKSWKTSLKSVDSECKKNRVEKFSKLYTGSDSESNNSDVVPATSNRDLTAAEKDSDPETLVIPQEASSVLNLSKANGSYTAYRSHVTPLTASDHGSEGHSSASETESTGSRRSVGEQDRGAAMPVVGGRTVKTSRYSRLQDSQSDASSTRSSYDEEQHRSLMAEGGSQNPTHTPSGIEIRRVCSPREALRSKAVIKPAIVEIDRKEIMSGGATEPLTTNGKPKISTKPVLANKMTSSITFYPNDPSSSRTSSRSSSISSEALPRERHTSTSNIVIGPSSEHRGSISIPYEISIPKSEITLRPCQDDGVDSESTGVLETARVDAHLSSRNSFSLQSPEPVSDFINDTESGFESGSSSTTTTVTNWRSHSVNHHSTQEDSLPDMRNITVRSTWRNRGAASMDNPCAAPKLEGSDDETESATTWRAYRATTVLDTEETLTSSSAALQASKPSPAEMYMRRINSVVTTRDFAEPPRRGRNALSPTEGVLQRSIPHEPVSAQELKPWNRKHLTAADDGEPSQNSWWRQPPGDLDPGPQARGRGAWSGRGPTAPSEARAGESTRPWSNRRVDN